MADKFTVSMVDCEATLLREIADPQMTKRDVSQSYLLAMKSTESTQINWGNVNRAIMERWSKTALIWIKQNAHNGKCFD